MGERGDRRPRGARVLRAGLAAALVAAVALTAGFAALGGEDRLEPCPVLVVLNGDTPARADEAARLYAAGVAPELWLTNDPRSGNGHADAGTHSNTRRLVGAGVPARAIHLVPGAAIGTRSELEAVAAELGRRRLPCAVVVTSPLHGPRVKATWWRHVGATPRLLVRHARNGGYTGWRVALREVALTFAAMAR